MKKFTMFLFAGMVTLSLVGCGNGGTTTAGDANTTSGTNNTTVASTTVAAVPAGPLYTVDAATVDPEIFPDNYPRMTTADFETAFKKLKEANMNATINGYEDLVNIFGIDGAYYKNCDMTYEGKLFKYYGWYAKTGENVVITFQANDNDLKYYAYVSNGIN